MGADDQHKCDVCQLKINGGEKYISTKKFCMLHPGCVRCEICDKSVEHKDLLMTSKGELVHRQCVSKPCSVCGKVVDPESTYIHTRSDEWAHPACIKCAKCRSSVGDGGAARLEDGRYFHAECFVCSVCSNSLQHTHYNHHLFWKGDFYCDNCAKECPACFCCEKKKLTKRMDLYPGGNWLCKRCSCLGVVDDLAISAKLLEKVLQFVNSQLGLSFSSQMLEEQRRDLKAEMRDKKIDRPTLNTASTRPSNRNLRDTQNHLDEVKLSKRKGNRLSDRHPTPSSRKSSRTRLQAPAKSRLLKRDRSAHPRRGDEAHVNFLSPPALRKAASHTVSETSSRPYKQNRVSTTLDGKYHSVINSIPVYLVSYSDLNAPRDVAPKKSRTVIFREEGLSRSITSTRLPVKRTKTPLQADDEATLSHFYGRCDCRTTELVTTISRRKNGDEWETKTLSEKVRQVKGIYLLAGLPTAVHCAHLAHELMHAWLFLSGFPSLDPKWEEGLCNYTAAQFLLHAKAEFMKQKPLSPTTRNNIDLIRLRLWKMEESKNPIYGEGYRSIRSAIHKRGISDVLNLLKTEQFVL